MEKTNHAVAKLVGTIIIDAYNNRVSEINRLTWDDVDLQNRSVTLYTRKKKGGHLTPRRIPMTKQLFETLVCRYENRDPSKPWVFWHRYWSRKQGRFVEGPYGDRKKLMKRLCKKAGVRYFRFHPIRHSGASIMDGNGVPLGAIQRILGHETAGQPRSICTVWVTRSEMRYVYLNRPDRNPHTALRVDHVYL